MKRVWTLIGAISLFMIQQVQALSLDDAKHLALRTSFAASPALVQQLLPLSKAQAIDYILNQPFDTAGVSVPEFITDPDPVVNQAKLSQKERNQLRKQRNRELMMLRANWIERMIKTESPLHEQLLLIWHNHFTTSAQKVNDPILIYQQHAILQRHALGRFDTMLRDVMADPAILRYLDNDKNQKGKPNENLARELLELFTLGEGHYSEQDIKEVARALSGWGVDFKNRAMINRPQQHDTGRKTVLGQEGNWSTPDILTILLSQPETAELIISKLWQSFISPAPDSKQVATFAQAFSRSGYDIKEAMRQLLNSDAFWAAENRGVLVKSPIEMLVGLYRSFAVTDAPYEQLARMTVPMGQNLFTPPNVKGWPISSVEWINTLTLLKRQTALNRLVRAKEMPMNEAQTMRNGLYDAIQDATAAQALLLLAIEPLSPATSNDTATIINWLNDPVYQLK